MEETLKNHEELDLWFSEIKKWSRYDCCENRRRIVEEILLALEDGGYRIWIKEVETATLIHNIHSSPYSPAMEIMDCIGEVVRFEDLNDDIAVDYEVAQSDLRKTYHDEKDDMTVINVVVDREVVQETPSLLFISNSNQYIERAEDKGEECTHSESRTKMVSFSQNGSSEEMLKTLQHLRPLENGEQPPPCFEKERNYHAYDSDSNTNPATLTSGENQLEEGEFGGEKVELESSKPNYGLLIDRGGEIEEVPGSLT
ncbi:hypothetical protein Cgig2_001750 [Carnegiea gigantea]|uniref:Uncharacterized protein n=1 Tax=Carnegiea gigantea TaxID=171969 RepID=A0A9Q1QGA2_9CARY|nr:hypothetical protein Cgig2_001750 [Carnegiea gigantea]